MGPGLSFLWKDAMHGRGSFDHASGPGIMTLAFQPRCIEKAPPIWYHSAGA
jgi:hypothetical protein